MSRSNRILTNEILRNLLETNDSTCTEDTLFSSIQEYEKKVIEKSKATDTLNLLEEKDTEIYGTVLEVALEDNIVTRDEYSLLEKLREKLNISRYHCRLIEAQLGKFPKSGNSVHDRSEFDEALKYLQSKGILFYCNIDVDENMVVIPKEIRSGVKIFLGFEMRTESHQLLHAEIRKDQLQKIARYFELSPYGNKMQLSNRIIEAGCKPSEQLRCLGNEEIYEICKKLKGVHVSGSKERKIKNIINYYDSLNLLKPQDSEDPRAKYYQYLEKLAARDNKELYRIKLIRKDKDMESYFEEGTRYLFEKKLGCQLIEFSGTDHADGGVSFPNKNLLLWDNKSAEKQYFFPESDYNQFRKYINNSEKRVNVFLIIVPEIGKDAELKAIRLKQATKTDTDVALITATDLKYVAENWKKLQKKEVFNLNVFNTSGILDRKKLETYLKLY